MDDELAVTQYDIPDHVVISIVTEFGASVVALVACVVLLRHGRAAVVGALGALLAGTTTGLALVDYLTTLYRDAGPIAWPDWSYEAITYGRAAGFALVTLAVLLTLIRTGRPTGAAGPVGTV
ncbi:hypothetical protein [Nocardioides lianchengensis]|uniref:Uncharacterized protein n=1 Tax=Nocardioides lianchengensis TaxID=1045774 RepID=A0A1G7ASY9_9ACTN|nr:hypothetical protein [Nocardioides lianchengensis]NYG13288.1 hypothetical protein [Nocardioides lianchengensis]SDE18014.1 hypothetical protein SAMN05421872_11665 [Nocardioides lianchengensis]